MLGKSSVQVQSFDLRSKPDLNLELIPLIYALFQHLRHYLMQVSVDFLSNHGCNFLIHPQGTFVTGKICFCTASTATGSAGGWLKHPKQTYNIHFAHSTSCI